MPELLQDFEQDTIPFPHPFTVWVLCFSFCREWGSLRRNNECTNNQPTVFSFTQCLLPLHDPSDLQTLPGAVSNLWGKGQWDRNVHILKP